MLNAVRRGPASIARSFLSPPSSIRCIHITIPRSTLLPTTRRLLPSGSVALSTTSRWMQRSAASAQAAEQNVLEEETYQKTSSEAPRSISHGPVTRFKELAERGMVCDTIVRTITDDMGLETMTQVQSLTINETLKGVDVLAQARTGTGKTLAFLIPVLQNIITNDPSLEQRPRYRSQRTTREDIRALIISPTRELAEQIAVEAKKVTRNTGIIVQTAVGGSAKRFGLNKIKNEGCHVLIGTPGRLNDVLSDPYTGIKAPKLSALVLDEADRLLDDGFSREIEAIQDLLPRRDVVNRQTLLFSATVPPEVMDMVRRNTKPDYKFVRTVQKGEVETHEKVPQKVVNVGGFENLMPAIVELCKRELDRKDEMPFKAIVYFPATAEVSLAALTLRNLKQPGESFFGKHPLAPAKIVEMHGKLTQEQRTRAADSFRHAECAIMLSSDVTARGMDFPNVTHVIQVGLPSNRDIYIHRIGRTARGDKKGEGWLLVTDMEMREVRYRLSSLPIAVDKSLETSHVDMSKDAQLPESTAKTLTQTIDATRMVDPNVKAAAYVACLGIFSWSSNKQKLVDSMNSRAKHCWGMPIPPSVSPRLVSKLNFRGVQGLNIGPSRDDDGEELRPLRDPGRGYTDRDRSPFGAGRSRIGSISRSSSYGDDAGGFRDRNGGGYGDRSRGGYVDRSGGEYGNRSRGEHGDRSGGEYGNRSRGEYGDRSGGGYGSRSSGGYGDRNSGGNPWAGRGRV